MVDSISNHNINQSIFYSTLSKGVSASRVGQVNYPGPEAFKDRKHTSG
jgi:hypothetical protein